MSEQAKQILTGFAGKIPATVFGAERVRFIAENIDKLPDEYKLSILRFANEILSLMLERQASDVEIGGHGAQNFIWFRTFGKKERVQELPQIDPDEAAILILCLLNKNQRETLLKERNLDFSYTFKYEKVDKNVRFRADAYFDLDTIALNMRSIQANVRPLESLEFHPFAVKSMSHNFIKFGLSLVTGITGSG